MPGLQTKLYHKHNVHMEENHCAYKVIVSTVILRKCPPRKRTTILPEISRILRQQDAGLGLEDWKAGEGMAVIGIGMRQLPGLPWRESPCVSEEVT